MKSHHQHQLRQELIAAGASAAEIKDLLPIANGLGRLYSTRHWSGIFKPAAFGATGLVIGMLLIFITQAAAPTSWLYPMQKLSDDVIVSLHSSYRANVMMKRAQQVNQLVANHAGYRQILATLADYSSEASAYKSAPHSNYAAFEYCKSNLQQAAISASPEVRQAIMSSLSSLENT